MTVLPRPNTPTHDLPGASFTSLATPAMGSVDTSVWEVRLSPEHPPTPHRLTRQEVFVVVSGMGIATLDAVEHPIGAGDALVAPADTLFSIRASGDGDLVAICCFPVGGQAAFEGGDPFTPPWAL
ncbi:MAG: hypothetical protein QOG22_2093 [Pseudonocardiales bacterium]|nr:hypothetical protein [Pseudonocardiales bacterium]